MSEIFKIPRRQAAAGTLLMLDWARTQSEARLAATVAARLGNPGNEIPPSMLAGAAVYISAHLLRSHLEDLFDEYVDAAFQPTGPTLVEVDLARAARVAEDSAAMMACINAAISVYGPIHTVVIAAQCLSNVCGFLWPERPAAATLDDVASMLAGQLFQGEINDYE